MVRESYEYESRPRGTRLPRRQRRAQLLSTALDVFVAQGYHATSMDEIADQAGVSKPVLYQHFPGKFELYLALLDESCDRMLDNVREALTGTTDNKERVTAAISAFYTYVAHDAGAFRLVFESDLTNVAEVREHVDRVTRGCAELITPLITEDTGLPTDAARLLAVSLVGMAQVSARFWLAEGGEPGHDQAVALVSGLAWRGIAGYPRTQDD